MPSFSARPRHRYSQWPWRPSAPNAKFVADRRTDLGVQCRICPGSGTQLLKTPGVTRFEWVGLGSNGLQKISLIFYEGPLLAGWVASRGLCKSHSRAVLAPFGIAGPSHHSAQNTTRSGCRSASPKFIRLVERQLATGRAHAKSTTRQSPMDRSWRPRAVAPERVLAHNTAPCGSHCSLNRFPTCQGHHV